MILEFYFLFKQPSDDTREKRDVDPSMSKITSEGVEVTWQKGMKLEVLDPFGSWNELRVSTVAGVMNDGFLKVNISFHRSHFFTSAKCIF